MKTIRIKKYIGHPSRRQKDLARHRLTGMSIVNAFKTAHDVRSIQNDGTLTKKEKAASIASIVIRAASETIQSLQSKS